MLSVPSRLRQTATPRRAVRLPALAGVPALLLILLLFVLLVGTPIARATQLAAPMAGLGHAQPASPYTGPQALLEWIADPPSRGLPAADVLGWVIRSGDVTLEEVGAEITLVAEPGVGQSLDCAGAVPVLSHGRITPTGVEALGVLPAALVRQSSCSPTRASATVGAEESLVGSTILFGGWSVVTAAQPSFIAGGSVTIAGRTVPLTSQAVSSAAFPEAPSPSASPRTSGSPSETASPSPSPSSHTPSQTSPSVTPSATTSPSTHSVTAPPAVAVPLPSAPPSTPPSTIPSAILPPGAPASPTAAPTAAHPDTTSPLASRTVVPLGAENPVIEEADAAAASPDGSASPGVESPTEAAVAAGGTVQASGEDLPYTGSDPGPLVRIAVGFVVVGIALMVLASRGRPTYARH